ncbi:MAG TPA: hypothetical protein VF786_05790 [Terriglobales bacterium]
MRLCVAAAKNDESLTVAMCAFAREEFLDVAGSLGPGDSLSKWVDNLKLELGDEITIKVVETDASDPPTKNYSHAELWPERK